MNIRFSYFAMLVAVIFVSYQVTAQPTNTIVNDVVQPTPSAASLGKFIETPVSYYTGVPQINCPIYEIKEGPLSMPVSLNYHAGGIRVGEMASRVGIGWKLNAGGMVTRTIQGLPDDQSPAGYYYDGRSLYDDAVFTGDELDEIARGSKDPESDIYSFSIPGYSGKFHFDNDQSIRLVPHQDIKISVSGHNEFESFTIVTPDGNKYFFGKNPATNEVAYEETKSSNEGLYNTATWYLMRVETHDGHYYIDFNYEDERYSYKTLSNCRYVYTECSAQGGVASGGNVDCSTEIGYDANHLYNTTQVQGKRLKEINVKSGTQKIVFFNDGLRLDLDDNNGDIIRARQLDSIKIISGSNVFCKKFNLEYDYLEDNSDTQFSSRSEAKRLRLKSLQELSCNGTIVNPKKEFIYHVPQGESANFFPQRLSKAIDHWGFYNGATQNDDERVNVPDIDDIVNGTTYTYQSNVDRGAYEQYLKYGSLEKVVLPTGGTISYTYEANSYKGFVPGNVMRLVDTSTSVSPLDNNLCMEIALETDAFTPTNEQILDGYVRIHGVRPILETCTASPSDNFVVAEVLQSDSQGSFSKVGSGILISLVPDQDELTAQYPLSEFGVTFSIQETYKIRLVSDNVWGKFEWLYTPQVLDNITAGGLRIKKIESYDGISQSNNIVKTYDYSEKLDPSFSSGKIAAEPRYFNAVFDGRAYAAEAGQFGNSVYEVGASLITFGGQSVIPLSTFQGNHIAYSSVRETANDGSSTLYEFYATTDYVNNFSSSYPRVPEQYDEREGELFASETKDNNSNTISSTLTLPESPGYSNSTGMMLKQSPRIKCLSSLLPDNDPNVDYVFASFFAPYCIRSSVYRVKSKTETIDNVSTTTTYEYDGANHLLPTASTVENSDSKIYQTDILYPEDFFNFQQYREMIDRNILVPIQTTKSVGSSGIVDGNQTLYALFDGHPYPQHYERFEVTWAPTGNKITNGWETDHTIHSYSQGYPTSMTSQGWQQETLTWTTTGQISTREYSDFIWQYDYHPGTRLVSRITDVDGQYTTYDYDGLMRFKESKARLDSVKTTVDYFYYNQNAQGRNYVKNTTTFASTTGSNLTNLITKTYIDGLGREVQSVRQAYSQNQKDIATATTYDNVGRPRTQYAAYETPNTNGNYFDIRGLADSTVTEYFADGLNRTKSVLPPEWFETTYTYGTNNVAITSPQGVTYPAQSLVKQVVTDPNGNKISSYADKIGRSILTQRLDNNDNAITSTYTQYDDKDRIKVVYPPGAGTSTPELNYTYTYDGEDLLLTKKIPGQAVISQTYDERNLLTYIEHSSIPSPFSYLATVYDEYGRSMKTGFTTTKSVDGTTNNTTISAANALSEAFYGDAGITISRIDSSTTRVLNGNDMGVLLTSYYSYDIHGRLRNTRGSHITNSAFDAISTNFKLDFADNILKEVYAHNRKSHLLKVINETEIDHSGRVTGTWNTIAENGMSGPRTQTSLTTYTAKDQIKDVSLGKTGSGYLQEVNYAYLPNEFLSQINGGSTNNGDLFGLSLSYQSPDVNSGASPQRNGNISSAVAKVSGGKYFTMGYSYDPLDRLTSAQYSDQNGVAVAGAYDASFTYDERGNINTLNRGGFSQGSYGAIDQLVYTYDVNSNRLNRVTDLLGTTLGEEGYKSNKPNDDYSYDASGNMIYSPASDINIEYNYINLPFSFKRADNSEVNYLYAADGTKLREYYVSDSGDTTTMRDYLGPAQYVNDTLRFVMHPNGRSVPEQVACGDTLLISSIPSSTSTYRANVIVSDAQLPLNGDVSFYGGELIELQPNFESPLGTEFLAQTEPCPTSVGYQYEYYLTDHLGNTRVQFSDLNGDQTVDPSEILQEHHYYPFGMEMQGAWNGTGNTGGPDQRYRFNGKELNEDLGLYDYGARWYDPAIARWTSVDPLASSMSSWSPYNYVYNNPLKFTDPTGMAPFTEIFNQSGEKVGEDENGNDGNVAIVTNKTARQLKKGKITAGDAIASSDIQTNKSVLSEADNVIQRTIDNGGNSEEGSVVTPSGEVARAEAGEAVQLGDKVAKGTLPAVAGNDNTSIHSHPINYTEESNGAVTSSSALSPGPGDPATFKDFKQNVIVGRLGSTKPGTQDQFGRSKPSQPGLGAAFFGRGSNLRGTLSRNAIKKIIKKR